MKLEDSIVLKLAKSIIFLRGVLYHVFGIKVGNYNSPDSSLIEIGYLDKERLVHTSDHHKHRFFKRNLYSKGAYKNYKGSTIRIVLFNHKVLIKKTFIGGLKERVKFYSELLCLHRFIDNPYSPELFFVDYQNLILYIEYLDGDCLVKITETDVEYPENIALTVHKKCRLALESIHNRKVAVIDLWSHNIVYSPELKRLFFIDFSDSICSSFVPGFFLKRLHDIDRQQLAKEVINKI